MMARDAVAEDDRGDVAAECRLGGCAPGLLRRGGFEREGCRGGGENDVREPSENRRDGRFHSLSSTSSHECYQPGRERRGPSLSIDDPRAACRERRNALNALP